MNECRYTIKIHNNGKCDTQVTSSGRKAIPGMLRASLSGRSVQWTGNSASITSLVNCVIRRKSSAVIEACSSHVTQCNMILSLTQDQTKQQHDRLKPLISLLANKTRLIARDVKSSKSTWSRGHFRPRPRPHAMLASFSRSLSSWPSCQSSKSRIYVTFFSVGNCCLLVQYSIEVNF